MSCYNYPVLLRLIAISLLVLFAARCTLRPFPPQVRVTVTMPDSGSPTGRSGRSGPEIGDMDCLGIVVKGEPNPVSDFEVGSRAPSCLGLDGAFFGPYTPDEMKHGVSLTVTSGAYQFSVVGFDAGGHAALQFPIFI